MQVQNSCKAMIQIKFLLSRAYMHTIWNFMTCQYNFGRITLPVSPWNNGVFCLTHTVLNIKLHIGFNCGSFKQKFLRYFQCKNDQTVSLQSYDCSYLRLFILPVIIAATLINSTIVYLQIDESS